MKIRLLTIILLTAFLLNCNKEDRGNVGSFNSEGQLVAYDTIGTVITGRPTKNSIVLNILFNKQTEICVEYSLKSNQYNYITKFHKTDSGAPYELLISGLTSGSRYYYRLKYKFPESINYVYSSEFSFCTAKERGVSFNFGVQGDSHPERAGKMFNSTLYKINLQNVSAKAPDFYFTLGDDFSIEHIIEKGLVNSILIDKVYEEHRKYLGIVGCNSSLFLINGNHEQAAKYLLDGTANNPSVIASNSRKKYYPLPFPDEFYSGDKDLVQFTGLLGDYYSFEWGDALFVVIDPYWHSDIPVDNKAGSMEKSEDDPWKITLGDIQYYWFKQTLESSSSKHKFVFSHHVSGTGRGGIEVSHLYEWGGYNQKNVWEFNKMRPNWSSPIHKLMSDNKVDIFFQGHDHLFAKQERDGVIYQTVPSPADDTYSAFNSTAYKSGVVYPNSGFLNIKVSTNNITVEYIGSFIDSEQYPINKNRKTIYSYSINK
ncbi:hypothetical protein MASR2M69_15010 [Bacteroidota bacterium]